MDPLAAYKSLLDKLGCAACLFDLRSCSIAALNEEALRQFGYVRTELNYQNFRDVFSAAKIPGAEENGIIVVRRNEAPLRDLEFRISDIKLSDSSFVFLLADREEAQATHVAPEKATDIVPSLAAVRELLACRDLETLCRKAVEFAYGRLKTGKCALWLETEGTGLRGMFSISGADGLRDDRKLPNQPWGNPSDRGWHPGPADQATWIRPVADQAISPCDPALENQWQSACELRTTRGLQGVLFFDSTSDFESLATYCSVVAELIEQHQEFDAWREAEHQRRVLKDGLQLITTAANELLACTTLDQLCRKAVELVRERLRLDRTALFLLDSEGKLQGTYGTTFDGTTSDEHGLVYDRESWAAEFLPPWNPDQRRWVIREPDHSGRNTGSSDRDSSSSHRWLTVTPICSAEGPVGIFCNDNAITGAAWNEAAQELLTMLATVLGTIIREKRAEEELWHTRLSLEQRVRERTAQLDLANTALQLEICERQRAERELRRVAKHARCILWYAKIQGLPGWKDEPGDSRYFRWNLHVQDEVAAQRVLPLEVPPGGTYADALGASFTDTAQIRFAAVKAFQQSKDSYAQEFCCRDMFGELRWLREDVQLQQLSDDRWEAFGLITDITTSKQAREEILRLNRDLQDRVTELQAILDTVPIGIAIASDPECLHIAANPYLARKLGISPRVNASLSAPQSQRPSQFIVCRDGKELAPEHLPMQIAGKGQAVSNVQLEIVRDDGETIQVMSNAVPLLDENGQPRGCIAAFADITERLRAEEELRNVAAHTGCILWNAELKEIKRSEQELEQGLPRFVWRVQIQDEKAAQKVLPLDVLPGQRYVDVWFASREPEDTVHVENLCVTNLNAGKTYWSYEYRCVNRFGEVQWLFESIRLKQRRPGRWQVFGVFMDITERKRAHEEVIRLASIVESSGDAISSRTLDGRIMTWNAGAEKLFGYTAAEVKGKLASVLVPDDRGEELQMIQEKVGAGKYIPPFETIRLRKDGTPVQVSLSISPIKDPSGKVTGVAVAARDISASKQLERDVLDISAHEQQRIGQDLHDGICQQLTGAYFLTSVLKHKLESHDSPLAADAGQVASLLSSVTEQARQLARGLHPLEAGPLGLTAALGELADQVNAMFKVECRFGCDRPVPIEDSPTATHLYRIAQEATNNAVRHGEATRISIELRENNGEIWLIVEDNGRGFHNELEAFQGMGLRTMRYRAGVIGAQLIIESGSPGGTLVCCILPAEHVRVQNIRSLHSCEEPEPRVRPGGALAEQKN